MFRKKILKIGALLLSFTLLATTGIGHAGGTTGGSWDGLSGDEPPEPAVIFNLREHLVGAAGGIGEGHFNFGATGGRLQASGAGTAVFTVADIDGNGVNWLSVTNRTQDFHGVDIVRDGLQAGDVITVTGRSVQAGTAAIDGATAPWPWWVGSPVGANAPFTLTATLTSGDMTDPGLERLRVRMRAANVDFHLYNIHILRPGGDPGGGGGEPGDPGDQTQTLVWSFANDVAIQALVPGHSGPGGTFNNVSPAMLVSGSPFITVVNHPTVENQIGLELSQRAENWHALDFIFPEIGVVQGGAYRFVASGRIAPGVGPGNRTLQWNQTDAPWSAISGSQVQIPGATTTWELDVTLNRYQINTALNAGQRGLRIQTGNAPTVTITVDDVFVYQIGEIDTGGLPLPPEWDLDEPSLAGLFEPYFGIGNIYSTYSLMNAFDTRDAFIHHFNVITAENTHKPDHIAGPGNRVTVPTPEEFNFTDADRIVEWAMDNDIQLVGHALVWHGQSPDWLFRNPNGTPLPRADAKYRMEFYMRTLSEHFAAQGTLGAFYSWDVVNEAIASGGGTWNDVPGNWRNQMRTNSPWLLAFANGVNLEAGEHATDFIWYAFYFARKYFPYSILYYNDYNEEIPAKRNAIAQMVEEINERWANHPSYDGRLLIEAIGMQSHYHLEGWTTNLNNVPLALDRFIATGARVSVTELDITYGGSGSPPYPSLTAEQLQRQGEAYRRIFTYYLERAEYLSRVSIWGMADHKSWRSNGFPLLFDSSFRAKPAFDMIVDLVENWETPEVIPPTVAAAVFPQKEVDDRIFTQLDVTRQCNAPVWFSVLEGNLPTGVVLHSRTGILEGTALQEGVFTFTVEVRNYGGATRQTFTIVVGDQGAQPVLSFDIFNNGEGGTPGRQNLGLGPVIRMWTQLDGVNTPVLFADLTVTAVLPNGECAMGFVTLNRPWVAQNTVNFIDIRKNDGAWNRIYLTATLNGVETTVILVNSLYVPINLSFDIFNNGEGGSPSRPNAGLATAGTIRMWTQINGVNTPVQFADLTVTATLPNGDCAMRFVNIHRPWVNQNTVNLVDVRKENGAWDRIYLTASYAGRTSVEVVLVNGLYVPIIFTLDIFNNGVGGSPVGRPNPGLGAIIRMWTQINGVNTPVLYADLTVDARLSNGESAMEFVRINRPWANPSTVNHIDVNRNAAWERIYLTVTVSGRSVEVVAVN